MAISTVHSNRLAESGYRPHPSLAEPFHRLALTADRERHLFVGVPRWQVLPDEKAYQRERLHFDGDCTALDDSAKLDILTRLFDPAVARTGIGFAAEYSAFHASELSPLITSFLRQDRGWNLSGLEFQCLISGIVQKCGTRGALERLFNLSRLDDSATIKVDNVKDNADEIKVTLTGDLFSAAIFLGLITPFTSLGYPLIDETLCGDLSPRIFQVADIGWGFGPHNLVVYPAENHPLETPPGFHMYTINIERVRVASSSSALTDLQLKASQLVFDKTKEFFKTL